ncbi:MAG TPA: ABC transporter substrate-binding protein, partial [Bryobacteraceae bacterium]|nr:ABC transporter substrate-binding protein [Bryobacteraceae bacterium]
MLTSASFVRVATAILLVSVAELCASPAQLNIAIRSDPKTLNPLLVEEESGELIRYLTSGVLMRIHRVTQAAEPELATSWSWRDGGRTLHLNLRKGVRFSDGSAFTAHDVVHTFERIMDPSIKSPLADAFRSGKGGVVAKVSGLYAVSLTFPATLPGLERLLDQVPILCRTSSQPEKAVLGPFVVQSQAAGTHVTLARNPNFWKKDAAGRALPYLSGIRLHVQSNRDLEALRFRRGELDMIRG